MVALEARLGEVSAAGGVEGSLQHSAAGGARLLVVGERHSGTNFVQALAEETWGDGAWFLPPAPGGGQHAGCEEEWQPGFDERTQLDVNVCCGKHGYLNESCVFRPPVEATIAVLRNPYSWLVAMLDETHLPGAVFPFADDRARCQRAAQSRGRVDRATSAFVVDYSSCAPWNFSRFLRQPMPDYVPDSARMSADWTRCGVANMQEHRGSADAACLVERAARVRRLAGPAQLWAAKARSYAAFSGPTLLLRHRELFDLAALTVGRCRIEPARITAFAARFARGRDVPVRLPTLRRAEDKDAAGTRGNKYGHDFTAEAFDAAAAYEARRGWAAEFTQDDLDYVNAAIDDEALGAFGFERVTSLP